MALSTVVLPPPLEPSSATTLPSGTCERHVGDADQVAVAHFEMLDAEQGLAHVAGPPISSIGVWPAAALAARVPR